VSKESQIFPEILEDGGKKLDSKVFILK